VSAAKKRPGGATQTSDERRAAGRVQLFIWLSPEGAADLETLTADGTTKKTAVESALRMAVKGQKAQR